MNLKKNQTQLWANPQGMMNIYEIIRCWNAGQTISGTTKSSLLF